MKIQSLIVGLISGVVIGFGVAKIFNSGARATINRPSGITAATADKADTAKW